MYDVDKKTNSQQNSHNIMACVCFSTEDCIVVMIVVRCSNPSGVNLNSWEFLKKLSKIKAL